MDSMDDSKSFFKHVFNFDDDSKSEILNIIQYTLIALIPVILLNKSMSNYVPEADDKKSSVELSAEIVIQLIVMFIGLTIIHRINTFVPTYSGVKYPDFHIIFNILAVLMIILSLQTKLGEKVQILVERTIELLGGETSYNGTAGSDGKGAQGGAVRITQPLSQPYAGGVPGGMIGGGMAPPNPVLTTNRNTGTADYGLSQASQQTQHFNSTYAQNVGAGMPGGMMSFEPMAANEVIGTKF